VTNQLVLLVVGFALTTVVGGLLGYWLQGRAWRRQERARLLQSESDAARAFFEDLSRIVDRRLHRMRELDDRLSRAGDPDEMERSLARYRDAVDEWNDNLNRILALAQRYFGEEFRTYLDFGLMSRVVEVGRTLQKRVHEYRDGGGPTGPALVAELDALRNEVIELNIRLIGAIQDGAVGVFRPDVAGQARGDVAVAVR
jgi:hypothetical protein